MRRHRQEEDPVDEDDVPLHHKRPFGSGLKRKRVEFVRATDQDHGRITAVKTPNRVNIGDLYASIVLGGQGSETLPLSRQLTPTSESKKEVTSEAKALVERENVGTEQASASSEAQPEAAPPICPVCSLPITTSVREHEATLAHQVSLKHSHPPSALDRSRMGLRTLAAQGWDPDARVGLGREGEGLRYPIKTKAKEDTLGIGATMPEPGSVPVRERPKPLSAKERKALEEKEKRRAERLQGEIFGSVDVERYLRGDGQ